MTTQTSTRLTGLLSFLTAASVLAQPADTESRVADEQIVVVGQKITRTLDDVQSSVFVADETTIEDKELRNFRDSFRLAANVIDSDWVDSGFIIRGVNSEGLTPGGSPLATLYIDGAAQTVQGARRGTRGLWDANRVEIFRGPQSTLSGRSSLAGAIHVYTNDPGFDWDARARISVGTEEMREVGFAFGGPIVDDLLAFRFTLESQEQENDIRYPGYEQYTAYDDFVTNKYDQARFKLLFTPEGLNGGRVLFTHSRANDSPTLDDIAGPGLGFEYSEMRGDLNAGTPFFQESRNSNNENTVLEISLPFGDSLTFTSVTSRADTNMHRPSINYGTPGEIFVAWGVENQTFTTQEFRINGDADAMRWVLGAYFAEESAEGNRTNNNFFSGGRLDTQRFSGEVESQAIFGEIEYDLNSTWTVVAGGRLHQEDTADSTYFSRDFTDPMLADVVTAPPPYSSDASEFLPKLGAILNLSPARSLSLTYSEGFRSGGAGINGSSGLAYTFAPEYLDNIELAYRDVFAGGRVRLAANVYTGDWTDQQVEVQLDPLDFSSTQVENAAESKISGYELAVDADLTNTITAFASIGRADTKFERFDANAIVDFSGLPFPQAPESTATLGLDYKHDSGVFFGFDVRFVDEYFARDYQNAPIDTVGDYTVANLRIGYRTDEWSVTLFTDNVTDEEYFVYRDVIGTVDCCGTLGARRLVGLAGRWALTP